MKAAILAITVLVGVAASPRLHSPKGREQYPEPVRTTETVLGVPPPPIPKSFTEGTNQHPGWVGLIWTYSPSANVSGYYMLQGTNSRVYDTRIDVGMGTGITNWPQCLCPTNGVQTTGCAKIYNLAAGVRYYFTVVAYSSFGDESPWSNEVDFTYRLKTNVTLLVSALMGPNWEPYTNLPPILNPSGTAFFRILGVNGTVAIQSAPHHYGIYTNCLTFPSTNELWKLSITRSNT